MKLQIICLAILLNINSNSCFSADLTDEYIEARKDAYKKMNRSFYSCRKNAREYKFWNKVSACRKNRLFNKKVDSTEKCFYTVPDNIRYAEDEVEHCEIFRPTLMEVNEYLSSVIVEKKS